jgi:hypothetical protein
VRRGSGTEAVAAGGRKLWAEGIEGQVRGVMRMLYVCFEYGMFRRSTETAAHKAALWAIFSGFPPKTKPRRERRWASALDIYALLDRLYSGRFLTGVRSVSRYLEPTALRIAVAQWACTKRSSFVGVEKSSSGCSFAQAVRSLSFRLPAMNVRKPVRESKLGVGVKHRYTTATHGIDVQRVLV